MLDPGMPLQYFAPDTLLHKKRLYGAEKFALEQGAEKNGQVVFFRAAGKLTFVLTRLPEDLSNFNRLCLRIKNLCPVRLLVGLRLFHSPKPGAGEAGPVSFSGGREIIFPNQWADLAFPMECFGTYGHPRDWSEIERAEIQVTPEKTDIETIDVRVAIHSLWGEKRKMPPGPRLTEAGLRSVLTATPESPAFFQTHGLYTSSDPGLEVPPPHSYPMEPADRILKGWIMGQRLSLPIDWRASPLGHLEWTHFLNRHHFMRQPVRAWVETGEARYITALDRMLFQWIQENPVPLDSNGGAGPAWETLSTAWRLREWLWVAGLVWPDSHFRGWTREMMLRSIWEHAVSLMHHQGHPNNWIIVESAALALAGMCFPDFHDAGLWLQTGLARLEREYERQFFSDGVHYELSPLYHAISVSALMEVKRAAGRLGEPLPGLFDRPLEKSIEYLAALRRPDFTWPALNDSGGITGDYTAVLRQAEELWDRPDFIPAGSRGRRGKPSARHFHVFPASGISIMKSDDSARAHYLLFRAGPPGASHMHEDALSLEVSAFGIPMLVDPGISVYAPGPITDYYRQARAHNMVLVNGNGPGRSTLNFQDRIRPADQILIREERGPIKIVTGVCKGPWDNGRIKVWVYRSVIQVRRQYWIIRDFFQGVGKTTVGASWQFALDKVEHDPGTGIIEAAHTDGSSLKLIPLVGGHPTKINLAAGRLDPPSGWVSIAGENRPAVNARVSVDVDLPAVLAWVLYPGDKMLSGGIQAVRNDDTEGSAAITITRPGDIMEVIKIGPPEREVEYKFLKSSK